MASLAQSVAEPSHRLTWFREFLKHELAPYPGRAALIARIVTAATVAMILIMTFRVPFGPQTIFVFLVSRETLQATVRSVWTFVISFAFGTGVVLAGAMLFSGDPVLRLLWVIGVLFATFYAISVIANYMAAVGFGVLVVLTIPLWDLRVPAEFKVENTLWVLGQITLQCVIALLVEFAFARLSPWDDLVQSIAERLAAVEELLACYAQSRPVDGTAQERITHLGMAGTSRLRRILRRASHSPHYREQMGSVVSLTGRLVDLAANLSLLNTSFSDNDQGRIGSLGRQIATIREDLLRERIPRLNEVYSGTDTWDDFPLLREIESTVSMIPGVLAGSRSLSAFADPPSGDAPRPALFVPDALSNPEHLKFALKGCIAASLCYVIYNAIDWPGISTAVTTCVLTALTTIGASRQKQFLRVTGAIAGGAVGLASQIFILPYVDSIVGFTLLFVLVTIAAAWLATSGPRLSYFGIQFALAFYFINLQEFTINTSLAAARDRVAGILLGLFMMWLVSDRLWGTRAAAEMERTFVSNLRLMAQYAAEPRSNDVRTAIARSHSLRETINTTADKVRAMADGVLFEFGATRQQDLALRGRILQWGPRLRALFVMRIVLLKYRLNLPGFELPEEIRTAQQEFDDCLAGMLNGMADRMEGKAREGKDNCGESFQRLERTVRTVFADASQQSVVTNLETFLTLSRRVEMLTTSLYGEI